MNRDHYVLPCLHAPRAESIRGALLGENVAREAAKRVRALADPTRLMLAAALRETQASSVYAASPGSPLAPRTSSLTTCASCPRTPTLPPDGTAKCLCIR
jgi:hypothetical protein